MSDIFREIDEEIRQEDYLALWKRYGPWVIAAAVLLVVAVAGYKGWEAYRHDQAVEAAQTYAAAVEQLNADETQAARDAFKDMAAPAEGGFSLLASFRLADAQVQLGNSGAALKTWQRIAEADGVAASYQRLATIQAVMHALDAGADVPELLTQRLSAIAGGDSGFRPTALEAQGLLAAKRGEREQAVEHYTRITEGANVPPAQRRRAEHMLALLKE
ncbi:hypothetical protein SAMN05216241_101567 [Limimonas halophila]|uniref:Ancillary SecYEG translocon subunit n=1 Tax=Limimonas halophila TaxID=1082479 RepID=A0A1G7MCS7_9PROT|nr:tetratricopeptide repeat protein [Limimonas halophila]SDF59582.1 hypothetical protein SAMN05216241_101567 [Limimonas halophila]